MASVSRSSITTREFGRKVTTWNGCLSTPPCLKLSSPPTLSLDPSLHQLKSFLNDTPSRTNAQGSSHINGPARYHFLPSAKSGPGHQLRFAWTRGKLQR